MRIIPTTVAAYGLPRYDWAVVCTASSKVLFLVVIDFVISIKNLGREVGDRYHKGDENNQKEKKMQFAIWIWWLSHHKVA